KGYSRGADRSEREWVQLSFRRNPGRYTCRSLPRGSLASDGADDEDPAEGQWSRVPALHFAPGIAASGHSLWLSVAERQQQRISARPKVPPAGASTEEIASRSRARVSGARLLFRNLASLGLLAQRESAPCNASASAEWDQQLLVAQRYHWI